MFRKKPGLKSVIMLTSENNTREDFTSIYILSVQIQPKNIVIDDDMLLPPRPAWSVVVDDGGGRSII